ncbi:MAG: transketolase [Flavobacteriaceae bacterium]|nr:MAG: transketolase [Flavobacteriaceae bacterium]
MSSPIIEDPLLFDPLLEDYFTACLSREISLIGRKEVLGGKAKFGIFGDGKELAQIALSKVFRKGDFRSGYYRDQTLHFALGMASPKEFFAQLYAHSDPILEPNSSGRQMNAHFATPLVDKEGNWLDLTQKYNSISDVSATAGQIPRLLGLAQASLVYKQLQEKNPDCYKEFSNHGKEVAFGTIGDASTAQGVFFEMINAASIMQVPLVLSIWDDGYGISVPTEYQRTKPSFSTLLEGFKEDSKHKGCQVITVNGWDYPALIKAYQEAEHFAREKYVPVVVHVKELTQPQGHSTSGSHQRYKSEDRLLWEETFDCNVKFKQWLLEEKMDVFQGKDPLGILGQIEDKAKQEAKNAQKSAWEDYLDYLNDLHKQALSLCKKVEKTAANAVFISPLVSSLEAKKNPLKREVYHLVRQILLKTRGDNTPQRALLTSWLEAQLLIERDHYSKHLYSQGQKSVFNTQVIPPTYPKEPTLVDGRIIVRDNFDALFSKYPNLLTFGEDVGNIGDVNQGMEGLQKKHGELQISDTGIREATIIGQGIGMALRGLRPIAEVQYLDYLLYCLYTLSDDLASLSYRTGGTQKAPLIIRTRGHRLEGIWHSGSPMGGILGYLRGILVLVPRNLTIAAGFYNTLLESDQPALMIESLIAYRQKEPMPENLGEFKLPLGKIEITRPGTDLTLVSYGTTWQLAQQASEVLYTLGIDCEVIDIQTLIPFDLDKDLSKSLQKTHRLLIVDEDVPGGGSAYILTQILEKQNGYQYLDEAPKTVTAKAHRPAYGSDGDYFSKPSLDDIVEAAYQIMHQSSPLLYPEIYPKEEK